MFKEFKLRFFGQTEKSTGIVNHSKSIIDNRSLNEKLLDEMFLEIIGEE